MNPSSSSAAPSFDFVSPPPPPAFEHHHAKMIKRGTACQTCRKRKLRCTGERPRCSTCTKNRHECLYEEPVTKSKSKSRVKQLEEKIASLESFLTAAQPSYSTPTTFPPSNVKHDQDSVDDYSPNPLRSSSSPRPHPQASSRHPPSISFNSTEADLAGQQSFSLALEELFGGPFVEDSTAETWTAPSLDTFPPSHPYPALSPDTFHASLTSSTAPPFFDTFPPTLHASSSQATDPSTSIPSATSVSGGFPVPSQGDTSISPALRDHLLSLFFQRTRNFRFALHIPRFIASLDGPSNQQPSSALLFSMYACAARFSNDAEVRSLDKSFLETARTLLQLALQDSSANLLHATQASTCLAALLYSRGNYLEGWLQIGASLRLIGACSLHRISSSSIRDYSEETHPYQLHSGPHTLKRTPLTRLAPPRDGIDLGERIGVFWSSFTLDRAASSAAGWPSSLSDAEIETPWPRPLDEYEKDAIDGSDQSISDLFSLDSVVPAAHPDGIEATFLKSITLFHRAARIGDSVAVRKARRAADNGTIFIPQPLLDLDRSLRKLVDDLPPSASTMKVVGGIPPWNSTVPIGPLSFGIEPTVFSTNTVIYATFMLLFEEMAVFDPSYRTRAVHAACSGVGLISHIMFVSSVSPAPRLLASQLIFTRFRCSASSSFFFFLFILASDLEFGHLDITIPIFWRHFARLLLEEAKRLGALGELEEASLRQVDVEVLVLSMKRMGEVWDVGETQASFIEQLQTLDISKESKGDDGNVV